ncbi:hypothetical protein BC938DRAFT_477406 [Jimgerdemannia flammicorona]|uniref:Uncharacterized protein n=1 Tax=Jimgerdemannia flammicorona TaxID=994334 RepID=A0A433QYV0_9FUNG|nr:hypothetical protein BC938DRAFT_477406 [Jimgerdemannia flammicorona]
MGAFDLGDVEETGRAADEGTARKVELRDGLVSTFVDGASTVGDAFTAFEEIGDEGVVFEALVWRASRMSIIILKGYLFAAHIKLMTADPSLPGTPDTGSSMDSGNPARPQIQPLRNASPVRSGR